MIKTTKLITVTDMMRSFSDIVSRVYYKGESFDIKKGSNIVARLSPVNTKSAIAIKDLNSFFKDIPHLDELDSKDFANSINEVRLLNDNSGFNKWD